MGGVCLRKRGPAFLLAICMCMLLIPRAAAAEPVIRITSGGGTAQVGDTVTVTAAIRNNPGFSAVQFTLAYDSSVVECVDASAGPALRGALSAANPGAPDGAIVAAASASELTSDGVLATFPFKVVGGGAPDFRLTDYILSDASGADIPFSVEGVKQETPEEPADPAPSKPPETPPTESGPAETIPPETAPVETVPTERPQPEVVEHKFRDTAGHWAESYINEAVDRGFFQGYADGTYRPGNQVTRGAFVTVLWRMAGRPQPTARMPFTDTAGLSEEFRTAIAWAYEKGYVGGRTATAFAPGDPVTRQAAMKILFLYAGGVSGQEALFTQVYDDAFADSGSMASWAKAPMYWGIYHELISGTTATTLGAGNAANRAQLAKILVNYTEKFGG